MFGATTYTPTGRQTVTDAGPAARAINPQQLMDYAYRLAMWRHQQQQPARSSPVGSSKGAYVPAQPSYASGPVTAPAPVARPAEAEMTADFGTATPTGPGIAGSGYNAYTPGMGIGGGNAPVATGFHQGPAWRPASASVAPAAPIPGASDDLAKWLQELSAGSDAKRNMAANNAAAMSPRGY